jgi:NADPH:quinone reductase-like Zn-dependent oxidoreductase
MKAIVFEEYGPPDVLHLAEIEKPLPKVGEVLIKVHATTVTKFDCWMRSCTAPPGFNVLMKIAAGKKPKQPLLGTELAGEIEALGENVSRLKVGDKVYAYPGMDLGAYAEYISLPEEAVALKPSNASFGESAAVLQGALTAFYFLDKANIQPGQKILIFGASGGVGGYAVQLAKNFFHAEVTGVCSTSKINYVKSLGANYMIDYSQQDFTQNGHMYDVIFDTIGKTSIRRTTKSIQENGYYLIATFSLAMLFQILWKSWRGSRVFEYGTLTETTEDLMLIKDLVESGVIKPIIDRSFPLEQAAEAHIYVEDGLKQGGVVLTV